MAKIDDSVKKKVPELRFKGFTDEWEDRKLSDIADRFDNLRVPITASDRKPGDTPYYGANGIQDYVEGFTHNGEFILVAEDGANDLKNYPVQYVNGKVWVNNHAHVLQGKKTITDNKFLMNAIKNFNIEPFLVGGGRAKLNADVMMKLNILLPTFVEQEKIGSLFSLLDKTIALHQRKLDLLKEQKKGYLQKMFPKNGSKIPELRFNGFSGDWEERKLGEITTSYSGGTPSAGNSSYYKGDIPFIRSGEINSSKTELFLTEEGFNNSSAKLVEVGDILYALYGATSGEVGISQINGAINQAILAIKPIEGYESQFIMQWLKLQKQKIIDKYLQGGQGNLSGTIVKDLFLRIPDSKEQKKIGQFFKQLDDTIALHQRKLDLLKEQKKGFLQKMFV
ncbi:restriction endonuclease subunit S (plasmid) [Enterococcus durans]|uniref:restriction endonuclease subunit S n=1 Tax=Enterococcus durans TaxID=53345 RepID=UPI000763C87A|nr:restriction endonuclease subunit S [Enterococcus durans]QPQ28760.1 restriction endonuclease subunit S [Enterococcus durans]QXB39090.1 restriction endonuclease subunit S [Enterococcus durans]